ncbi:SGNH/GDSL hydrolase family protein [Mucilaginibacter daejeonensis]|uniref:SGNH/GDSL hydrolase family protein n=1 Tax=Mucilaginibacter daejeonensis TaxID=398049 RepID=UPI001D16FCE9|nr:SGNH/GDSL hydrolase family protein [Mucilaginibacter daejeonensis]UEG52124.1 SGNH/GDSL hydrolase family protein [Mucilaginibacter daejeonensis]
MTINRRQVIKGIGAGAALLSLPPKIFASDKGTFDSINIGVVSIINSGIGGNNTNEMLARIEKDCLAHHPKLTILMAGTNDMNSVKHVPLEQYEANMHQLARLITKSGSKLLIMTILPLYEPYLLTRHPASFYQPEGVATRRRQVNEVIKKVAKAHRAHLLDIGMRFEAIGKVGLDKDSLIQNEANANKTDGIHPTANGYRFIGLSVYEYITANKLPTEQIVCFGDSITKGDGSNDNNSYPGFLNKLLTMNSITVE